MCKIPTEKMLLSTCSLPLGSLYPREECVTVMVGDTLLPRHPSVFAQRDVGTSVHV